MRGLNLFRAAALFTGAKNGGMRRLTLLVNDGKTPAAA